MLKRLIILTGVVLFLILVAGCYQVKLLVKLNPNGSGTIEEEFLMSKSTMEEMGAMMGQMMGGMMGDETAEPEVSKTDDPYGMFDEAKLKELAAKIGEGVTYVSGNRIQTEQFDGYKAVYSFTDINKLKVNQNFSEKMPSQFSSMSESEEPEEENVTFNFTKGTPAQLVIRQPENMYDEEEKSSLEEVEEQPESTQSDMMMPFMQNLFKDMKITMEIEVQGKIVQTNASYQEGSRITLMDLDFGKLFEAPGGFEKFSQSQPNNMEDAKQMLKDLPGVKVELNKEIVIRFQ